MRINKGDYVPDGFPAFSAKGQDGFVAVWEYDRPAVVLSAIGARCGKCFLATGRWTSLANTHLIFPDVTVANPKFLWYQLNDESSWIRSGSAQPFIKPSDIKTRKVKLPPLSEQERIVGILDEAEGLRQRRAEADRRTADLLPALFHHMFGDPATNPKGWPLKSFDETFLDETSKSPKLLQGNYANSGRFPVVDQGQDFVAGYSDDESMLCKSVLPVLIFGDHTRVVKLVTEPFIVGADGAKVLIPRSDFLAAYAAELLRNMPIRDLGYSRHMKEVKRQVFMCPPLSLQREFAERVGEVRELERRQAESRRRLDALFAALLDRAFNGSL